MAEKKAKAPKKPPFQKFKIKTTAFFAVCSDCGWKSETSRFKTTVQAEGEEHQREASGLDPTLEHKTNVVEERE